MGVMERFKKRGIGRKWPCRGQREGSTRTPGLHTTEPVNCADQPTVLRKEMEE